MSNNKKMMERRSSGCVRVRDVKLQATGRESSGGKVEFQD
jgi:hypothetical protein